MTRLIDAAAQSEWNNHTVACLLAELFNDTCACNYKGIDEWLPEKCELLDSCPNPVGVACWEQFLTHKAESHLGSAFDAIEALPSAQKKGEWYFDTLGKFYCSNCKVYPMNQVATTGFCPNCGADMRQNITENLNAYIRKDGEA